MADKDSRELASINDQAEEETTTLGGPTAKKEGTEYQLVSEIGREVAGGLPNEAEHTEQGRTPGASRNTTTTSKRLTPDPIS